MLLISLIRTIVLTLCLLLTYTFVIAYDLTGIPLILTIALVAWVGFSVSLVAESAAIEKFNTDAGS